MLIDKISGYLICDHSRKHLNTNTTGNKTTNTVDRNEDFTGGQGGKTR